MPESICPTCHRPPQANEAAARAATPTPEAFAEGAFPLGRPPGHRPTGTGRPNSAQAFVEHDWRPLRSAEQLPRPRSSSAPARAPTQQATARRKLQAAAAAKPRMSFSAAVVSGSGPGQNKLTAKVKPTPSSAPKPAKASTAANKSEWAASPKTTAPMPQRPVFFSPTKKVPAARAPVAVANRAGAYHGLTARSPGKASAVLAANAAKPPATNKAGRTVAAETAPQATALAAPHTPDENAVAATPVAASPQQSLPSYTRWDQLLGSLQSRGPRSAAQDLADVAALHKSCGPLSEAQAVRWTMQWAEARAATGKKSVVRKRSMLVTDAVLELYLQRAANGEAQRAHLATALAALPTKHLPLATSLLAQVSLKVASQLPAAQVRALAQAWSQGVGEELDDAIIVAWLQRIAGNKQQAVELMEAATPTLLRWMQRAPVLAPMGRLLAASQAPPAALLDAYILRVETNWRALEPTFLDQLPSAHPLYLALLVALTRRESLPSQFDATRLLQNLERRLDGKKKPNEEAARLLTTALASLLVRTPEAVGALNFTLRPSLAGIRVAASLQPELSKFFTLHLIERLRTPPGRRVGFSASAIELAHRAPPHLQFRLLRGLIEVENLESEARRTSVDLLYRLYSQIVPLNVNLFDGSGDSFVELVAACASRRDGDDLASGLWQVLADCGFFMTELVLHGLNDHALAMLPHLASDALNEAGILAALVQRLMSLPDNTGTRLQAFCRALRVAELYDQKMLELQAAQDAHLPQNFRPAPQLQRRLLAVLLTYQAQKLAVGVLHPAMVSTAHRSLDAVLETARYMSWRASIAPWHGQESTIKVLTAALILQPSWHQALELKIRSWLTEAATAPDKPGKGRPEDLLSVIRVLCTASLPGAPRHRLTHLFAAQLGVPLEDASAPMPPTAHAFFCAIYRCLALPDSDAEGSQDGSASKLTAPADGDRAATAQPFMEAELSGQLVRPVVAAAQARSADADAGFELRTELQRTYYLQGVRAAQAAPSGLCAVSHAIGRIGMHPEDVQPALMEGLFELLLAPLQDAARFGDAAATEGALIQAFGALWVSYEHGELRVPACKDALKIFLRRAKAVLSAAPRGHAAAHLRGMEAVLRALVAALLRAQDPRVDTLQELLAAYLAAPSAAQKPAATTASAGELGADTANAASVAALLQQRARATGSRWSRLLSDGGTTLQQNIDWLLAHDERVDAEHNAAEGTRAQEPRKPQEAERIQQALAAPHPITGRLQGKEKDAADLSIDLLLIEGEIEFSLTPRLHDDASPSALTLALRRRNKEVVVPNAYKRQGPFQVPLSEFLLAGRGASA